MCTLAGNIFGQIIDENNIYILGDHDNAFAGILNMPSCAFQCDDAHNLAVNLELPLKCY